MILPKKQILYAPMLSTFGGGSLRGFNPGGGGASGGDNENYDFDINNSTGWTTEAPTMITVTEPTDRTWIGSTVGGYGSSESVFLTTNQYATAPTEAIEWNNSVSFSATSSDYSPSVDTSYWSGLSPINRPGHTHFYSPNRALISGLDEGYIMTVTTSTDYDISTISSINYKVNTSNWFSQKVGGTGGGSAFMNSTGTVILARGYAGGDPWKKVTLSTAHDPSSAGSATTVCNLTAGTSLAGACISPDGRFIYDVDYNSTNIRKIDAGSGNTVFDTTGLTETVGTGLLYNITGGSYHSLIIDFKNNAGLDGKCRVYMMQTNVASDRLYVSDLDIVT
jgi:hypothetical protein